MVEEGAVRAWWLVLGGEEENHKEEYFMLAYSAGAGRKLQADASLQQIMQQVRGFDEQEEEFVGLGTIQPAEDWRRQIMSIVVRKAGILPRIKPSREIDKHKEALMVLARAQQTAISSALTLMDADGATWEEMRRRTTPAIPFCRYRASTMQELLPW